MTVAGQTIRFTAYRRRSFWFPKLEQTDFLRSAIVDVERHDALVGLTVLEADGAKRPLQFRTVSASDAESLATLLPDTKLALYVNGLMAERSQPPVAPGRQRCRRLGRYFWHFGRAARVLREAGGRSAGRGHQSAAQ